MRILPNIVNISLGLVLLTGAIGVASAQGNFATATTATAPNCMAATLDAAGEGRRAFMRLNCYSCHGMGAKGGIMAPNIAGAEAGDIKEVVPNGSDEGMPAFKKYLCTNDIANLTAYLRLVGTGKEPTFTEWWVTYPAR